jgi:hypothetical protein
MPSNVGEQVGESEITPAKILSYQLDLIRTTGSHPQSYGAPNLHLLPLRYSPMSRPGSGQLKVDAAAMAWPCR